MHRKAEKESWLYGVNPVLEALRSGRTIKSIHLSRQRHDEVLKLAKEMSVAVEFEEREFFDSRFPKGHQGVAALAPKKKTLGIDDLLDVPEQIGEPAFFLILDCIEDPRNFGAILRGADAAGVHGVVFQSHRSAGLTPVVSKVSAGAMEHVNLVEVVNVKHAIEKMKKRDILIIGAEAGSERIPWDVDMKVPLAIVVGSEGHGLRRTVGEMCDMTVSLPMKGRVNSLNVSVAAGVISYEVLRQRSRRS